MRLIVLLNNSRSRKILFFAVCLVFLQYCGSANKIITNDSIKKDMNGTALRLESNMNYAYELKTRAVGKSGFYYILSRDGVVVFHPQAVLIGSRMGHISFVREVLERESGCLSYGIEDKRLLIFFRPVGENNILCLSIYENELKGQLVDCVNLSLE